MQSIEDLLRSFKRIFELRRQLDQNQHDLNRDVHAILSAHEERLRRLERRHRDRDTWVGFDWQAGRDELQ